MGGVANRKLGRATFAVVFEHNTLAEFCFVVIQVGTALRQKNMKADVVPRCLRFSFRTYRYPSHHSVDLYFCGAMCG